MEINTSVHIKRAEEFIKEVAQELNTPRNAIETFDIIEEAIFLIRNFTTIEDSFEFAIDLPFYIRAIFFEGWEALPNKERRSFEDFLKELKFRDKRTFVNVQALLNAMKKYQAKYNLSRQEKLISLLASFQLRNLN